MTVFALDGAVRIAGVILLGVLAIVLGDRMLRAPGAAAPERSADTELAPR